MHHVSPNSVSCFRFPFYCGATNYLNTSVQYMIYFLLFCGMKNSRVYSMKRVFYYLFILLVSFSSCNKEDNEENIVGESFKIDIKLPDELQNQITKIIPVADLENGNKGVIGVSCKTSNGFEVYLQDPLNSVFLYPLKKYADFMHGEIGKDVMCYGSVSFYAYKENEFLGTLRKDYYYNESEKGNELSYSMHLMYVTDDTTVTGKRIIDGQPFRIYNVSFKQGWNLYICTQTIHYTIEGIHDYTSLEFTSEIPDNLGWRL